MASLVLSLIVPDSSRTSSSFGVLAASTFQVPVATAFSPTTTRHLLPSYTSFTVGPGFGGRFSSITVLPLLTRDTVTQVPWSLSKSPGTGVANRSTAVTISPLRLMRKLSKSDFVLSVRVILHRADDVAFRIAEEDQMSDGRDERPRNQDRAAVRHHGGGHRIDVRHRDAALVADRALAFHELAAFLEGAPNAGVALVAGANLEEAGRPPGLEAPGEDALVEAPRPVHVVGVDG